MVLSNADGSLWLVSCDFCHEVSEPKRLKFEALAAAADDGWHLHSQRLVQVDRIISLCPVCHRMYLHVDE